ncbi:major facilitator superfamily domain-containing protein [Tricladium varicosporioides]|nr:major facilitator superfamily domain-containing protein [Hymenoscyphus varicosporioides]
MSFPRIAFKFVQEIGLYALWLSTLDIKLLCLLRFIRLFAYGSSTLILVSYLSALEISKSQIGLFMTLTLVGDMLISFVLTLFADSLGRRMILVMGSVLMGVAGVVFALSGNYWALLIAAVLGVISPSGTEIGPFRAIEESIVAHLTPEKFRGDIYAWYSLLGATGAAFGMGVCGWILEFLLKNMGWDVLRAYRTVFWAYFAMGGVMLAISLGLSKQCEPNRELSGNESEGSVSTDSDTENSNTKPKEKKGLLANFPKFMPKTRTTLIKLALLFALDSFACTLAPLSWITFFFQQKFTLQPSKLGTIFFITTLIAAFSMLGAPPIARRLGNIKTMILTHAPSAILLALLPVPSSVVVAITILVLRSCMQSMDTPPRSAFLASIVTPSDRTAALGILNISRTAAACLSPLVTGSLAAKDILWVAFVLAGSLMVVYDLGIFVLFGRQEKSAGSEKGGDVVSDEEKGGSTTSVDTLKLKVPLEKVKTSNNSSEMELPSEEKSNEDDQEVSDSRCSVGGERRKEHAKENPPQESSI